MLGPLGDELLEVAVPSDLLPSHRAVDRDLEAGDMFEDAVIGGRRATRVVLRLKPVDGDG